MPIIARRLLRRGGRGLAGCRAGSTAIEYALIAGVIATVLVGSVISIGGTIEGFFQSAVLGLPEGEE